MMLMEPVESIELGWITTPGGISKRDIHSILGNTDIKKNDFHEIF